MTAAWSERRGVLRLEVYPLGAVWASLVTDGAGSQWSTWATCAQAVEAARWCAAGWR